MNFKNITRYQIIFICLLSLVLYFNTLFNDYALDDKIVITQNTFTKMGFSGIKSILTNDEFVGFFHQNKTFITGNRYRPLAQIVFAIQYSFFGSNPFIAHLFNILSYALLCVLIFIVLNKLFDSSGIKHTISNLNYFISSIPFLATILFVAHPLHTEVVANIKSLDELLDSLFSFLTLFLILKYIDSKKHLNLFLSFITFLLALLAKENAVTFLAIIPLSLWLFKREAFLKQKIFLVTLIPLFVSTCIYLFIRFKVLGFIFSGNVVGGELLNDPFLNSTAVQKFATIMLTWGRYLLLLIFPINLTHDYYPKQIPIIEFGDMRAILPLLIYLFILVYSIILLNKKSKHQSLISFSILFFLIAFSVQSNLFFSIGTFMNERFLFLPLLGFCIVLTYLVNSKIKSQILKLSLLILILAGYSFKTISRNRIWKNDYTLFTTDVNTSSNSAKCNLSAGEMYFEEAKTTSNEIEKQKLFNRAEDYINKSLVLYPGYVNGWALLGNVYVEMKNYMKARQCYDNVLKMAPLNNDARNNLLFIAETIEKNGMDNDAISIYKSFRDYKFDPGNLYRFALVYEKIGKLDSALVVLNNLISQYPDYFNAYAKIGEIYGWKLNDPGKSVYYLKKAFSLQPVNASVAEAIGSAYEKNKEYENSIFYFSKALSMEPSNIAYRNNLAKAYKLSGNNVKASNMLQNTK